MWATDRNTSIGFQDISDHPRLGKVSCGKCILHSDQQTCPGIPRCSEIGLWLRLSSCGQIKRTPPRWRHFPWWRHQMETFSALPALCAGNSPVAGDFPSQRPVTRSFHVFFDLRLNKWLSKQGEAGDLTRYRANYDVIVMLAFVFKWLGHVVTMQRPTLFHSDIAWDILN